MGPVPLPEPSAAVIPAQAKDPELCAKKWAEAEKAPGLWSLTLYYTRLISLQFNIKVCMRVSPLTRSHHADPVGPDAVVQTSLLRRSKKGGGLRVISHPTPSTPTQPIREASSCLQSFSSRGPRVGGHLPDVTFPSVPSLGGLVPKPET